MDGIKFVLFSMAMTYRFILFDYKGFYSNLNNHNLYFKYIDFKTNFCTGLCNIHSI